MLLFFAVAAAITGYHFLFGTKAATPTTPTIAVCGARVPSDVEEYTGPALGSSPISTRTINGTSANLNIQMFSLLPGTPDKWYVKDQSTFYIYNASTDALISSVSIASARISGLGAGFGLDSSGNIYVSGTGSIYKFNSSGTMLWNKPASSPLDSGVYSYGSGAGFRVAAIGRGLGGSYVWDSSGNPQPNNIVTGKEIHTNQSSGDIMSGDGESVHVYSPDGMTQKFYMGTNLGANTPGPFHFYASGGIEELGDGRYVVADGHGLYYFDSTGLFLGKVNTDPYSHTTGAIDFLVYDSNIELYNGRLYFVTGTNFGRPQHLSSVSLTAAQAVISAPQGAPSHLGIGAGFFTTTTDNFFASGTTPQVSLQFYQWWQPQAANFTGSYTVRSIEQIKAGQAGSTYNFSIPTAASAYVNNVATVPITLPAAAPGDYEINAHLYKAGQPVGADCLNYTVGEPSSGINTASPNLTAPSGGDTAGIEQSHQFGQHLYRSNYNLPSCYPGVTAPTMATTAACPAAMISDTTAAAALAKTYGMNYEIQVGAGGTKPLLAGGTPVYQHLIQQMVAAVPSVMAFECWNEPDINTFSSGTDYVNRGLIPCHDAVKAVRSAALVVGGSFSSMSPTAGQWTQFIASGLPYVDVIAFHTYPGHNRSFEEQGYIIPPLYASSGETGIMQQFQAKFAAAGFHGQYWDTEQGFWADGPYNTYTQGDRLIRKQILERSIGINDTANFLNNVGYSVDGLQFTLVHNGAFTSGGAASGIYGDQLYGRPFVTWLPTNAPHTYAAEFGPGGGKTGNVVIVWSDDFSVNVVPVLSGGGALSIVDEFGQSSTIVSGSNMTLTGSVQYIAVPSGHTLSINPTTFYSANIAASAKGATASASSSWNCGSFSLSPDRAIDGIADMQGHGNICDTSASPLWVGGNGDASTTLTISLPTPQTVDRVYVSSQGLGSVEVGLRDYTVSFDTGSGSFTNPIAVTGQFLARNNLINLPSPLKVSRIQISKMDINYSGYGDGLPPIFWTSGVQSTPTIYEVEAYGPASNPLPPDTTPPTIALTAPTANATITGKTVPVNFTSSDNVGVSKVELYVDNATIPAVSDSTPPFNTGSLSWDSSTVANGAHTIKLKAYDVAGNSTIASVNVTTNNPIILPPDLVVTSISTSPATPATGNQVTFKATVKNQGSGPTPAGVIIGVRFSVDNAEVSYSDNYSTSLAAGASVVLSADNGPTGSATWTATTGTHTILAVVDDINRIPNESNEDNNTLTSSITVGTTQPPTLAADFNTDHHVDITDLSILAAHYGQSATQSTGDANHDGTVNVLDLSVLASEWGQ